MWVGHIIWIALGVNQTHPHLPSRDCSHWSGPIVSPWLQAKPEAGHLSPTWSYQLLIALLLWHAGVCIYVCVHPLICLCVCLHANTSRSRVVCVCAQECIPVCLRILYTSSARVYL